MNLLLIETSPRGQVSASREVAQYLLGKFRAEDSDLVRRDLAENPLPHITGPVIEAFFTPPDQRNDSHHASLKNSDAVIDELIAADAVIISTPMWNFGLPSVLKAWLDHLSRAGRTFSFVDGKPKGLLDPNKKVYFIISSGSRFSSGPFVAWDFAVSSTKAALGFLGLLNFEVIRVEGTNDPVSRDNAVKLAKEQIDQLFAREEITA